jgi:hypothetical protein
LAGFFQGAIAIADGSQILNRFLGRKMSAIRFMNYMIPIALSINFNVKLCHCRYLSGFVLLEYGLEKSIHVIDPASVELRTFSLTDVVKRTEITLNPGEFRVHSINKQNLYQHKSVV